MFRFSLYVRESRKADVRVLWKADIINNKILIIIRTGGRDAGQKVESQGSEGGKVGAGETKIQINYETEAIRVTAKFRHFYLLCFFFNPSFLNGPTVSFSF